MSCFFLSLAEIIVPKVITRALQSYLIDLDEVNTGLMKFLFLAGVLYMPGQVQRQGRNKAVAM